ncbi:MAG: hypothetical protein Q8928_03565 [Bacteroidota bacterium]|nr:hypothetical protein [Bacteroidota bacterium]
MASIRSIKKSINDLTFELVSECYSYKLFHPEKLHQDTDVAIDNIIQTRNKLIQKVNNPTEKTDAKKNKVYFKTVTKELADMVLLMDKLG